MSGPTTEGAGGWGERCCGPGRGVLWRLGCTIAEGGRAGCRDRPNHSEMQGPWQDETTSQGQLGPAAYQSLSLDTKSTAAALTFLGLQPHQVSPGATVLLDTLGHCLSLEKLWVP